MRKFECVQQLFDEEICFSPMELLLSLEAYLGGLEMIKALEYISKAEDWRFRIDERGEIHERED